jgi:hypothetical protein
MDTLLTSLAAVRWSTALRVFGNDHGTLVGLLVDWWISGNPATRWALEGGPSFGYNVKGVGGGQCDAILGEGATSRGLIEVEGTRYLYTLEKIGKFFGSTHAEMQSLQFAIFLAYAYGPTGVGPKRHLPPVTLEAHVEVAKELTAAYPGRYLAVLALDKTYERQKAGPRHRNEYYWGRPWRIRGALLANGDIVDEATLAMRDDATTVPGPSDATGAVAL